MRNKLSKLNDAMAKFNDENAEQSITTIPGKYAGAFNRFMFIVFSGMAILPIFILLLGGPISQLFLSPFGFFMAVQYRIKIKEDTKVELERNEIKKNEL